MISQGQSMRMIDHIALDSSSWTSPLCGYSVSEGTVYHPEGHFCEVTKPICYFAECCLDPRERHLVLTAFANFEFLLLVGTWSER